MYASSRGNAQSTAAPVSSQADRALRVYGAVIGAWIVAWLLKVALDSRVAWLATSGGGFLYWTLAKIVVWLIPAVWLLRRAGLTIGNVLHLPQWRTWLAWGGGIGLAIALSGWLPKLVAGQPLLGSAFDVSLANALVVAPLFEEFLMRGAILGSLLQTMPFWRANAAAALMFLGLHLPGWYFMGVLRDHLTRPVGGALSIFLLGLAFGYAARRGRSVLAASVAHFLNNLASA